MPLPDRWSLWAGRGCPRRCGKPSRELVADRSGATGFSTPPARSTDLFTLRGRNPLPTLGPGNPPSRLSGHAAARTGQSGHRPPRPGSGPPAPGPPQSPPGDWSVFSHSGMLVTVLFPADAGMNRSKKQAHPMTVEWSTTSASGGQADAAVSVSPFQEGGGDIEG